MGTGTFPGLCECNTVPCDPFMWFLPQPVQIPHTLVLITALLCQRRALLQFSICCPLPQHSVPVNSSPVTLFSPDIQLHLFPHLRKATWAPPFLYCGLETLEAASRAILGFTSFAPHLTDHWFSLPYVQCLVDVPCPMSALLGKAGNWACFLHLGRKQHVGSLYKSCFPKKKAEAGFVGKANEHTPPPKHWQVVSIPRI